MDFKSPYRKKSAHRSGDASRKARPEHERTGQKKTGQWPVNASKRKLSYFWERTQVASFFASSGVTLFGGIGI